MLRRVTALLRCSVHATDGEVGRITDAYIDDEHWAVRYLVVDTGMWLGWHVLVSPEAVAAMDWERHRIEVDLTRDQVEHGPRADVQRPLSRLYEAEYFTHFGYPPYWDPAATPAAGVRVRSWDEIRGFHLHATDGEIGHVDDLLLDDSTWLVRFIDVDTSNWIGGRSVLVSRDGLGTVSWADRLLEVTLTREQVRRSPGPDEVIGP